MSEETSEPTGKPAKKAAKRAAKRARKAPSKSSPEATIPTTTDRPQSIEHERPTAVPTEPAGQPSAATQGDPAKNRPKRRRGGKKGKGNNEPQEPNDRGDRHDALPHRGTTPPAESPDHSAGDDAPPTPQTSEPENERPNPQPPARNPQPANRPPRRNPDELADKAWRIFLAEVSEEGIALINDNDARDIARRCFRLAGIFLEEQSRQR